MQVAFFKSVLHVINVWVREITIMPTEGQCYVWASEIGREVYRLLQVRLCVFLLARVYPGSLPSRATALPPL